MKKNSKQAIPADLRQKMQLRSSVSKTKDFILAAPQKPWKHSNGSKQETIVFDVKFGAEKSQQSQIKWLVRDHALFNTDQPMEGNMSVALSLNSSRMEAKGASIHGEDFIYIKDKASGFLYLDKKQKTYIHMPEDKKMKHRFSETIKGEVKIIQGSKQTATAELVMSSPYKIKYVLELDTDKKWLPYSKQATCMLIGCPDNYNDAGLNLDTLTKTGIPIKGEVFMEQTGGRWQKMSSFNVSGLKMYEGKTSPFDIPAGYRDFREVNGNKKGGKKNYLGPATKLSDFRKKKVNQVQPGFIPDTLHPGIDIPVPHTNDNGKGNTSNVAGGLQFPTCLPETYGALIANVVDEKLLDDVKFLVNGISKRLTGFSGTAGTLDLNWMDQFKTHADALGDTDPGGGLYTLLHDEELTSATHTEKLGLLDKLAFSTLSSLLAAGDRLLDLSLDATLQAAVDAIIADTSVLPEDRFISLTVEQQGQLIDIYVFDGIGNIKLTYPSSTGAQTIFFGLVDVQLDNITFDIDINNTEIISTFDFDSDSIHLVISLPDASGEAWASRWPTLKYWLYAGLTVVSCFLFPGTCFLISMALAVGVFLLMDFAYVSLELADLVVDSHIRLVPNGSNVLQPEATLTLDATVSAFYMSVIPTGVHQILSLIYDIILNATDLVINTMQSQLETQLNSYLQDDLQLTYPPEFGPVPLVGIANAVDFSTNDFGYVEQSLNAGLMGTINPYVTQVDSDVKPNIMTLRDQFKAEYTDPVTEYVNLGSDIVSWAAEWALGDPSKVSRYYLGTVLSQNFINDYIYTLWRQQRFNHDFNSSQVADLLGFVKLAFPALDFIDPSLVTAHLWPAVPPRTLFTPKPASEGQAYATTFFDDVRICMEFEHKRKGVPTTLEFAFAGQASTEIGFGGYNFDIGKLDLLRITDRAFDIYFDLKTVGVNIIHPEVEYFAYLGIEPAVNFDYSPLDLLQDMFRRGLAYSLTYRDSSFIPRSVTDPMYIQRYPLGNDALQVVFQLVPFRGNLYVSKGISGLATAVLEGALDIDAFDKETAVLIRQLVAAFD
jgi:hypothetical protein